MYIPVGRVQLTFTVNSPSLCGSSTFSSNTILTSGGSCKVEFAPEIVDGKFAVRSYNISTCL